MREPTVQGFRTIVDTVLEGDNAGYLALQGSERVGDRLDLLLRGPRVELEGDNVADCLFGFRHRYLPTQSTSRCVFWTPLHRLGGARVAGKVPRECEQQ